MNRGSEVYIYIYIILFLEWSFCCSLNTYSFRASFSVSALVVICLSHHSGLHLKGGSNVHLLPCQEIVLHEGKDQELPDFFRA